MPATLRMDVGKVPMIQRCSPHPSWLVSQSEILLFYLYIVRISYLRSDWRFYALIYLSDGELYSGTSADFMGRDFAIFRTLGSHHPIRTEQHDSRWLNGKYSDWTMFLLVLWSITLLWYDCFNMIHSGMNQVIVFMSESLNSSRNHFVQQHWFI